jgi:hypothetical protein
MKKVLTIILVVLLTGLMGLTACGGQSLTDSDIATIRGLIARMDSAESQIASLQGKVGKTDTTAVQADIDQAKADIAAVKTDLGKLKDSDTTSNTKLAELEARIKALEDKLKVSEASTEFLTTRWQPTIELEITSSQLYVKDYSWSPVRIKDEDTYRFTINIVNTTGAAQKNQVLVIVLVPSSKDTSVDIANIGVYSASPVGIGWDAEYSPSSGVDCRRMEFISDEFTVPAAPEDSPYTVKVDFDLYYAK